MKKIKSSGYVTYVIEDVLAHLSGITYRAMFGGYGIYQNGYIFALIADDQLYFKVDESSKADYQALGSQPFTYEKANGKQAEMSYWFVPEEIQADPDQLNLWVKKSVTVSMLSKKKKGLKKY